MTAMQTRRGFTALMAALVTPALPHGVHSTRTLIDYLSTTGEVQITFTIPAEDFEEFLRFETKKQIELDRDKDADQLVFNQVQKWLQLQDSQGKPLPLKWVGMDVKSLYVTCYVETKTPKLEGVRIRNLALLDWEDGWVNQVIIRRDQTGTTSDHQFKKGQTGFSAIRFPAR